MQKEKNRAIPGWVIWFVGLPGAGKSTYARAVFKDLENKGEKVQYLSMDEWRKINSPNPKYTWEERVRLYRLFAEQAAKIAYSGINVIMDGTAPQLSMRHYARSLVPRFAEVFVHCPLEIAIEREDSRPEGMVMAGLYKKALRRKETGVDFPGLGEVIGVDVPFEEDNLAECVINSEYISVEQGRDQVLSFLAGWEFPAT